MNLWTGTTRYNATNTIIAHNGNNKNRFVGSHMATEMLMMISPQWLRCSSVRRYSSCTCWSSTNNNNNNIKRDCRPVLLLPPLLQVLPAGVISSFSARGLSSAAAAAASSWAKVATNDEEDSDNDDNEDINANNANDIGSRPRRNNWTRLQALRRQLQQENSEYNKDHHRWGKQVVIHRETTSAAAAAAPDVSNDIDKAVRVHQSYGQNGVSSSKNTKTPSNQQTTTVCSSSKSTKTTMTTATAANSMSSSSSELVTATTKEEFMALVDALPPVPAAGAGDVLADRFRRRHTYLRLSLTERCNLRCTYCMPAEGVPVQPSPGHLMQTDELVRWTSYLVARGVRKLRLTGGEPTLRRDLVDLVRRLDAIPLPPTTNTNCHDEQQQQQERIKIGITTNGILLGRMARDLVEAGVSSINISLDTLNRQTFAKLTRRPATYLDKVLESIQTCVQIQQEQSETMSLAQSSSLSSSSRLPHPLTIKLNCVVMRGINEMEVYDFCHWIHHQYPTVQLRFIEYMPFTDNGWGDGHQLVPYQELLQQHIPDGRARHAAATSSSNDDLLELTPLPPDDPHDTTKWYQMKSPTSSSSTVSKVGFITSMSDQFCAGCNRLRLTADGNIKVCLFDGRLQPVLSIRDALRHGCTDDHLDRIVAAALFRKHYALGGHKHAHHIQQESNNNRPMTLIGG